MEVDRYDECLRGYQRLANRVQTSLSLLNWGQNLVFSVGLTAMMVMAANGVAQGNVGLTTVNAFLTPFDSQPLSKVIYPIHRL